MNFLKKVFSHKNTIPEVLSLLENFSNTPNSLDHFVAVVSSVFGNDWKFNLEMYISTQPKDVKEKYYPLLNNVLEYDNAVILWKSATRLVKGIDSVSSGTLKTFPNYEKLLPKFGIEGTRLLEKLKKLLEISSSQTVVSDTELISETEPKIPLDNISDEEEDKNNEDDVVVDNETNETQEQKEYKERLKQKILQKVQDLEMQSNTNKEEISQPVVEDIKSELIDEKDWDCSNFKAVVSILPQIREIMSAISIYKNSKSIEEYQYYGFILDIMNYLIEKGNHILSTKSQDVILSYFPDGNKEIEDIIDFYKKQKENEIDIIPNVDTKNE